MLLRALQSGKFHILFGSSEYFVAGKRHTFSCVSSMQPAASSLAGSLVAVVVIEAAFH